MKNFLCIFLLCCVLAAGQQVAAAAVQVSAAAEVETSGETVCLGDIAQIDGTDPAQTAALGAVVVGRIAAPGKTLVLSAQILALRVKAAGLPENLEVEWNLPDKITIHRQAQSLEGSLLETQAQQKIEEELKRGKEKRRYTIETISLPKDLRLPAGNLSYETAIPGGIRPALPVNVEIGILIDGKLYKKIVYRARVHMYEPAVETVRPLLRGAKITKEDLQQTEKEVTAYSEAYLKSPQEAEGWLMARNVRAGTILTRTLVEKPVIIERGKQIHLVTSYHGVRAQMDGTALESGREGETIRVRNESSKRILSGVVLDPGTVQIPE